jgi:hypothetical protein
MRETEDDYFADIVLNLFETKLFINFLFVCDKEHPNFLGVPFENHWVTGYSLSGTATLPLFLIHHVPYCLLHIL